MKKRDVRNRIQDGFSELSPDMLESILIASEKENPAMWEAKPKLSESETGSHSLSYSKGSRLRSGFGVFWRRFPRYASFACAGLAILFVCLIGITGTKQEDTYLILDINPSVQIAIDDSFQVNGLQGLNQDGEDLLSRRKHGRDEELFGVLEELLESAVEGVYLKEDSGILVTICSSTQEQYKKIENKMGKSIDRKLKDMGIHGIATAFLQGMEGSRESGRRQLEETLTNEYGVDESQAKQMSVMELLRLCREHTSLGLTFSSDTDENWDEFSENEKDEGKEDVNQAPEQPDAKIDQEQEMKKPEGHLGHDATQAVEEKEAVDGQQNEDEKSNPQDDGREEPGSSPQLQEDVNIPSEPAAPAIPAPENGAGQPAPSVNKQDADSEKGKKDKKKEKKKKKEKEKDEKKKDKKNKKDPENNKDKDKNGNQEKGEDGKENDKNNSQDKQNDKKDKKNKDKKNSQEENKNKNEKENSISF